MVVLFFSHSAQATQDLELVCRACYARQMELLLSRAGSLEKTYAQYRWFQSRLRRLYYEDLWRARQDQMDPVSESARERGKREEGHLLKDLQGLEKKSRFQSNRFVKMLPDFQQADLKFSGCCREKVYGECVQQAFGPVYEKFQEMRNLFEHVFEQEREHLKAVSLTSGQNGLYLEDTLESKERHTDYYDRLEREQEARRFGEDEEMRKLFSELHRILDWDFPAERCCEACVSKMAKKQGHA